MKAVLGLRCSLIFLLLTVFLYAGAQTHTPRYNTSMTANTNGFYEYLPQGYNPTGSATYPVIIFLHGMGELGSGGTGADGLSRVLANGPPRLINQNQFPTSFTVNSQTFRFIVISPQFVNWPTPTNINNIINYVILNYRANPNRIYLTGLSMGGGVTWDYAGDNADYPDRLAAIVPVCGASWPENFRARMIATNNLPVWATHNNGDPTVPLWYTESYIDQINAPPPPVPAARKTVWTSNSHDAWTRTYNPNTLEFGANLNLNIYQWMLQYQRNIVQIPLPVVLTNYTATLTNSTQVTVAWTTTFEQNNDFFTVERSQDGINFSSLGQVNATNIANGSNYSFVDPNPANGDNYYRLSQTDIDGTVTYYAIKKVRVGGAIANTVQLYPNPVKDNIVLKLDNTYTGELTFRVFNAEGKVARTVKVTKSGSNLQQTIAVGDLPVGYYTLEIRGTNYNYAVPFIKQ